MPRINTVPRPRPLRKLGPEFYSQRAIDVCVGLLGAIMVRRIGGRLRRARIVEVEAYLGPKDLASHSSKGRTARTEVMFGPAGRAYVFVIYGIHPMFNIVVGDAGEAEAVLIRSAEPLDDWRVDLAGPGRLARAFEVTLADNGLELSADDIHLMADDNYAPRVVKRKRVGVDYAQRWKDRLLRFIDASNPAAAKLRR